MRDGLWWSTKVAGACWGLLGTWGPDLFHPTVPFRPSALVLCVAGEVSPCLHSRRGEGGRAEQEGGPEDWHTSLLIVSRCPESAGSD